MCLNFEVAVDERHGVRTVCAEKELFEKGDTVTEVALGAVHEEDAGR